MTLQRAAEALAIAEQILHLSREDEDWGEAFRVRVEAHIARVRVYRTVGDPVHCLQSAHEARAVIEAYAACHPGAREEVVRVSPPARGIFWSSGSWDDIDPMYAVPGIALRMAYGNLAAELYFARAYAEAIPLFEQAIAYRTASPYCHAWHAASVWATTKDRRRVLDLLRRAARVFAGRTAMVGSIREFADLAGDAEFVAAVSIQGGQ